KTCFCIRYSRIGGIGNDISEPDTCDARIETYYLPSIDHSKCLKLIPIVFYCRKIISDLHRAVPSGIEKKPCGIFFVIVYDFCLKHWPVLYIVNGHFFIGFGIAWQLFVDREFTLIVTDADDLITEKSVSDNQILKV